MFLGPGIAHIAKKTLGFGRRGKSFPRAKKITFHATTASHLFRQQRDFVQHILVIFLKEFFRIILLEFNL